MQIDQIFGWKESGKESGRESEREREIARVQNFDLIERETLVAKCCSDKDSYFRNWVW